MKASRRILVIDVAGTHVKLLVTGMKQPYNESFAANLVCTDISTEPNASELSTRNSPPSKIRE